jgi:hypothetical protein
VRDKFANERRELEHLLAELRTHIIAETDSVEKMGKKMRASVSAAMTEQQMAETVAKSATPALLRKITGDHRKLILRILF